MGLNSASRPDFISIACDLCGGHDHEPLFIKEGFRHVRCRSCHLVFVNPIDAAHLEYQRRSGTGELGDLTLSPSEERRFQRQISALTPWRQHNRILEVGAGKGWFLVAASRQGWEAWAVEINQTALESLAEKCITKILNQSAEDFQVPEGSMDVVRLWDVIEHLPSPRRALRLIYQALRPGGLLLLSTTNFASFSRWANGPEWVYLNGADHIVLFEPATITRLIESTGFKLLSLRTRGFKPERKLYHPEQVLPARLPLVVPLRNLIHNAVRFTRFGHQLIVRAVKPETPMRNRGAIS